MAAQAAQSGLLVIAPALALVVATQTVSFLAPAVAIIALGIGQLVLAPRFVETSRSWTAVLAVLGVGAAIGAVEPLTGIALLGVVVGMLAPTAQAALLQLRIADGSDDFEANALAGKAAIVGQILGPATGYGALSLGPALATSTVGLLGGSAARVWESQSDLTGGRPQPSR